MDNIRQLLELNTEIEGLLRVAEIRETEVVKSLLLSKTEIFTNLLRSSITKTEVENHTVSTEIPDSHTISDIQESHFREESNINPVSQENTIPLPDEVSEETETVLEMEIESTANSTVISSSTNVPPVFNTNTHITPNVTGSVNAKLKDNVSLDSDSNSEGLHVMRVDEMIQRQSSRDLKKAFSLNDRFRYIREIFDNNASYFDETINNLEMLSNLDEVYEYLLSDIGLNHEDETVKEFLAIVYNHFNA